MLGKRKKLNYELLSIIIIIATLLSAIYACLNLRATVSDGSRWLSYIIENEGFVLDAPHWRFSNFVLQLPIVIVSKMNYFLNKYSYLVGSFNIIYTLYHVFSMIFIIWFLRKIKKLERIIIPFASFLLLVIPASIFPTNSASDAICVFWPLILIQTFGIRNKKHYLLVTSFLVFIIFSYSTTLPMLLVLLLNVYLLKLRNVVSGKFFKFEFSTYLSAVLIKLGITIRLFLVAFSENSMSNFYVAIENSIRSSVNFFYFLSLVFIAIMIAMEHKRFTKKKIVSTAVIFFVVSLFSVFSIDRVDYFWSGLNYRAIVVQISSILALMFIYLIYYDVKFRHFIVWFVFIIYVGLVSIGRDISNTDLWKESRNLITKNLRPNEKCTYLNTKEFKENFLSQNGTFVIDTIYIPFQTLFDSLLNKKSQMLFVNDANTNLLNRINHCENYHQHSNRFNFYYEEGHAPFGITLGHDVQKTIDFQPKLPSYSLQKLLNCKESPIVLFENDIRELDLTKLKNGTWLIKLHLVTNSNPISKTILTVVDEENNSNEYRLEPNVNIITKTLVKTITNKKIKIEFKNFKEFTDTFHRNTNYYELKCVSFEEI